MQKIKFNWIRKEDDFKAAEEKINMIQKGVLETGENLVKLLDAIFKSPPTALNDSTNMVEQSETSSMFPTAEDFTEAILTPFIERGDFAETSLEAERYRKNIIKNLEKENFQNYSFWHSQYIMATTFVVSYAHHLRLQDKEHPDEMIALLTDEEFKIYLKKDFEKFCLIQGVCEENCPTAIRIAQEKIISTINNLSLDESCTSSLVAELEYTSSDSCLSNFG